MDKELGAARMVRWNKAFTGSDDWMGQQEGQIVKTNRKATIVIEHLIQASDISHTMQHWHVYVKWNECLFHELNKAFLEGRLDKDPALDWYEGELAFFDNYIIPLTKKLFTCGVFGVSSDEYLNNAIINRKEWAAKGEAMVEQYQANAEKMYGTDGKERATALRDE
jgi:3'5'-cyclic nucleotide phosphodiesterase